MLRITIEELPAGDPARATVIDRVYVANVSRLAPTSDYHAWSDRYPQRQLVPGHRRFDGSAALIIRALAHLGPDRWRRDHLARHPLTHEAR